jgi:inorganic triphosphatase YgiF
VNGLEIELKAGLSDGDARRLVARLQTGATPEPAAIRLHAIYFDTADRRLAAAGAALRVRREGRRLVQTVKAGRNSLGGFHQVREVESRARAMVPDLAAIPDLILRQGLEALCAGQTLEPLFETRVTRRRWTVVHAHGLVDVALDRGEIRSGTTSEAVLEAEFELLGGSPEALFAVAADLVGETSAKLTLPSKAARGHALAAGRRDAPDPIGGKPQPPLSGMDGGFAWAAALEMLAPAVASALFALFTDAAPQGPHQLRVALRRLRAAVALHSPVVDPMLARELATRARDLGRRVAPLRDTDVLSATVLARAGNAADAALAAALEAERAQVRAAVCADLRQAAATGFAVRLLGLATIGGWHPRERAAARSVDALAGRALGKLWKRARRLGDRLSALEDPDRHEFRKTLKKVRYILEIMPNSSSKKIFTSSLKKLQEDLGTLNDISVLEGWNPALPDAEVAALLAEVKADIVEAARNKGDLALGRACRHWRDLRGQALPWELSQGLSHPR